MQRPAAKRKDEPTLPYWPVETGDDRLVVDRDIPLERDQIRPARFDRQANPRRSRLGFDTLRILRTPSLGDIVIAKKPQIGPENEKGPTKKAGPCDARPVVEEMLSGRHHGKLEGSQCQIHTM